MSDPNNLPAKSSTERAVAISAAVVLPAAVLGLFALRQLLPAPELSPTQPILQPAAATVESSRDSVPPVAQPANVPPAALVPSIVAATPRPAVATAVDVAAETTSRHAPPELSHVGRALAGLSIYAPRFLPAPEPQELADDLAGTAADLDLYAGETLPLGRFEKINEEVVAERRKFTQMYSQLLKRNTRGERNRRLARTRRGRKQLENRLTAALYNADDPFRPLHEPLRFWLNGRSDLAGLPLAMGDECRLDTHAAEQLQGVSARFRTFRREVASIPDAALKLPELLKRVAGHDWSRDDIPGLIQVLSAEEAPLRKELVRVLERYQFPKSSQALARIATFDRSADVREKAVEALEERPREEFRDELLSGLRYVWPPAADNAARALVALDDRESSPKLAELLRRPDPRAPYRIDEHRWEARELVRVNHMRNCLLCHAPVVALNARVTAPVPVPYDAQPFVYYERSSGSQSEYLVRADVTYLRQDFSVVHTDDSVGMWPGQQRFDYLVRRREMDANEAAKTARRYSKEDYPQRRAVLYAMRKLLGNDAGRSLVSAAN